MIRKNAETIVTYDYKFERFERMRQRKIMYPKVMQVYYCRMGSLRVWINKDPLPQNRQLRATMVQRDND